MKKLFIITFCIISTYSVAISAQNFKQTYIEQIGFYKNSNHTQCKLMKFSNSEHIGYIVHCDDNGVTMEVLER